jgi:hypothetical protein
VSSVRLHALTVGLGAAASVAIVALAPCANADTPALQTQTLTIHYLAGQEALVGPIGTPTACSIDGPSDGQYQNQDCVDVTPPSWAQYVTITSKDNNSPLPVPMMLAALGAPGTVQAGTVTNVCGSVTDMPVPPAPGGMRLDIDAASVAFIDLSSGQPPCTGLATEGTITVVYSNLP